jgi:hypothetical protein
MSFKKWRFSLLISLFVLLITTLGYAGPPFNTDDPEPVNFKHWEYYIASINTFQRNEWMGTAPHVEVNYGLVPNVQVHLLLPMNYSYIRHEGTNFGYGYTELGMKYRFVQESDDRPQIGVFPIVEVPTVKNQEFSNGRTQVYIPLWIQKSWRKLTTYGGVGYWINPGDGNKNWLFAGWEVQYDFSPTITLGGELYYHTANTVIGQSSTAFNVGGSINFSSTTHFIFSVGHSLDNDSFTSSYVGLLWTI